MNTKMPVVPALNKSRIHRYQRCNGISKGGQTTIFHRYFYPADVDISVPYVAPLNLEYVDPRLDKFLNRVLIRSGREEQAMMTTLAGLIVVLMMIINEINTLFETVKTIFGLG